MATIGIDNQTGLGAAGFTSASPHTLMDNFATYTPASAESVTEVGIQKRVGDTVDAEIGVYRLDTNALIGSATVTSSDSVTRVVTALSLSLIAGVTYGVAVRFISATTAQISYQGAASRTSALTGSSALANPFVEVATDDTKFGIFATTVAAPAYSIDTITSSVQHGGSGSFTYTGLGTISAMTVDGIAVASVSGTGGSGTFTMPSRVDGATIAGHGSKTVVITGSLGSANTTINVVEAAAQQFITVTSLGTGVGDLSRYFAISTTDEITSDTPTTLGVTTSNIGLDTRIHTNFTGTQTIWWWKASTKVVTRIYLVNGIVLPRTIDFRGKLLPNTGDPIFQSSYRNGDRTPTAILYSEDFESSLPAGSWGATSIITDTAQTYLGSAGSVKAIYPATLPAAAGSYAGLSFDLSPHCAIGATNHVYFDFYAKMPNVKHGLKFCKIFGGRSGINYANTSFGLDYTGIENGGMTYVAFGDGTGIENDTANGTWLDGSNPAGVGRSYGLSGQSLSTPQNSNWLASNWGTGWHRFQFYVKFNSGTTALNEVNDGAVKVIIDGVTYVDAVGLYNRHYSNAAISEVYFFDWSQDGSSGFDVWIDSLRISQNGWTR